MSDKQNCFGCGATGNHPWVALMAAADLPPDREPLEANEANGTKWVTVPVCDVCHKDPARRSIQIKGHFFPVNQGTFALRYAGSSSIG